MEFTHANCSKVVGMQSGIVKEFFLKAKKRTTPKNTENSLASNVSFFSCSQISNEFVKIFLSWQKIVEVKLRTLKNQLLENFLMTSPNEDAI